MRPVRVFRKFYGRVRRGRCPHRPKGTDEFAGDFRKIGFTCRVDVLNRPLRKFGTFHPYEHPGNSRRFRPYACPGKSAGKKTVEHGGGFGSGRSALRVEIEVIAAQDCLGDGPLNGGQCFVRHRIRVREAREAVSGKQIASAVLRVPVEDQRELLAGDSLFASTTMMRAEALSTWSGPTRAAAILKRCGAASGRSSR